MKKNVKAVIFSFVSDFSRKKNILESDLIFHDLGIGGDDAAELFEKIASSFNTNMSQIEFDRYFPNEVEDFWYQKIKFFKKKKLKLSVGHLIKVVEKGEWFPPLQP